MADELDRTPSAVRIELLGGNASALDDIAMPGPGSSGPSRLPAAAMIVALVGVFGALWWLSNVDDAQDPSADKPAAVEERIEDEVGDDAGSAGDLAANDRHQRIALGLFPTYVARSGAGVIIGGAPAPRVGADASNTTSAVAVGSLDGVWRSSPWPGEGGDHRLVGLYDNGDRFIAFSATVLIEGSTELVLHTTPTGRGGTEDWTELSRFPVDGHVRTVSSRDGQWAAIVDRRAQSSSTAPPMQTQILTGRVDGDPNQTTLVEVAPDEFVSSFAATADGFYAIVVRLQLGSLSDAGPEPQLRRWVEGSGWELLEENFSPAVGVSARIIDVGASGTFISWRTDLFRVESDLPVAEWPEAASGSAVTGVLDDTFTPEVSPARVGGGFLIVDRTLGEVGTLWLSLTGDLWQRFDVDVPVEHVSLLKIDETGVAFLSGEADGQPIVFRRA